MRSGRSRSVSRTRVGHGHRRFRALGQHLNLVGGRESAAARRVFFDRGPLTVAAGRADQDGVGQVVLPDPVPLDEQDAGATSAAARIVSAWLALIMPPST